MDKNTQKSIDRGDGIAQCVCPCGYTLASDGKTCQQTLICPFDVTFWFDGSSNVCASDYGMKQKAHMADMVDFFRREVRTFDSRIAAGVYSDGSVSQELSTFDATNVDVLIGEINTFSEPCGEPSASNVFAHFVSLILFLCNLLLCTL